MLHFLNRWCRRPQEDWRREETSRFWTRIRMKGLAANAEAEIADLHSRINAHVNMDEMNICS